MNLDEFYSEKAARQSNERAKVKAAYDRRITKQGQAQNYTPLDAEALAAEVAHWQQQLGKSIKPRRKQQRS